MTTHLPVKKVTGPGKKNSLKIWVRTNNAPPSENGLKNIDFSKVAQNRSKTGYRGIFCQNFRFWGQRNSKSSFWWSKYPQIMRCYILKNWISSYFLGVFAPQRPKKVIFRKKVKLTQNHFLGLFFPEIYDFEVKNTKKHRFGGLNDLRFGWYKPLTTSKIFIFEQKKILIFQFFSGFIFSQQFYRIFWPRVQFWGLSSLKSQFFSRMTTQLPLQARRACVIKSFLISPAPGVVIYI